MAGVNQLLPFANGETPNVIPYDEWNALAARLSGFQSGIASSKQFNYILAQGGAAGYVIGQMVADYTTETATIAATPLYQAFKQAMSAFVGNSPVLADGTTTARSLKSRFADSVNVLDFGAVGNGVTDDTSAIQSAIVYATENGKACFIPSGEYLISEDIYLPSNSCVYGAGKGVTTVIISTDAPVIVDGFCNEGRYNAKYKSTPQTTYDENIYLSNLSIDMQGWDRTTQGTDTVGGCGVKLAGVKIATVYNVEAIEPVIHGFDCSAFEVTNNFNVGHFNYDAVQGGCENILFFNTQTRDPVTDDGITTHFATNVTIIGHRSVYGREGNTVSNNQAGVEFDGGSQNCQAIGCYVNGFAKGYSALGHYTEPPARNICFSDCLTESVFLSVHLWCVPTEIPLEDRASKTCARNVTVKNLTIRNPYYNTTGDSERVTPFRVDGYANVVFDGIQVEGIDSRNQNKSVQCFVNGYYGVFRNIFFSNFTVKPQAPEYYGVITTQSTESVSSAHNTLENVFFDTVSGYSFAIYDAAGGFDVFKNILSPSQDGLTKGIRTYNPDAVIENVNIGGIGNQISVMQATGSTAIRDVGTYLISHVSDTAQNLSSTFMGRNQPHIMLGNSFASNGGSISYPDGTQFFVGTWNTESKTFTSKLQITSENNVTPGASDTQALGSSVLLWSQLYAASGTINTSDERFKTSIEDPDDALIRAWKKVSFKVFQFKSAVDKKGEDARLHVGVIAQQVIESFESEGLDPFRLGIVCYDEWDDQYEEFEVIDQPAVLNANGEIVVPAVTHTERNKVIDAGNRLGIRYEEALALECACQRKRIAELESTIEKLVEKVGGI